MAMRHQGKEVGDILVTYFFPSILKIKRISLFDGEDTLPCPHPISNLPTGGNKKIPWFLKSLPWAQMM